MFKPKNYRNSTELTTLNGVPIYMHDMVEAALRGRLNVFLQGDTGSGKTQLARDVVHYFGDKSLFILGRNDMDTRELFQQVNPEFLKALKGQGDGAVKFKELTDKIDYNLTVVDELPNCVPAVRAQLFNLFDGFIEIDGKAYPLGSGYSVGIATGNIGQQFTESSNDLGRALKDRMHLVLDTDYFRPQPIDTLEMLAGDRNPRVNFGSETVDKTEEIKEAYKKLNETEVPFNKLLIASYLIHGLDYLDGGKSKIGMKSAWPNAVENHEKGSDAALILPVSPRAAKAVISLSQALDQIVQEKGAEAPDNFESMMQAFKFISAYSGILNEALVRQTYGEDHYKAMDAVITTTQTEFSDDRKGKIAAAFALAAKGKKSEKLAGEFTGRWSFMKNLFERVADENTR
ncbi:MAG: AAA family ATPase [Candidatus Nanoarchaeia archaeon]|nr:AAA family ATPase [Candidatus Nanoarchaeia archaeon]